MPPEESGGRTPMRWIVAATACAALTSVVLAFVPMVKEKTPALVLNSAGQLVAQRDTVTMIDRYGAWILLFLLVPVVLAAIPLLRGGDTRTTVKYGLVLVGFILITGFFVSRMLYYVPTALLLLVGAGLSEWRTSKFRTGQSLPQAGSPAQPGHWTA